MPLVKYNDDATNSELLADGYRNFASMMGNKQNNVQQQASAEKIKAETLAQVAQNAAMSRYRDNLMQSVPQGSPIELQGPTRNGGTLLSTTGRNPLTKEQVWQKQDLYRRMAVDTVSNDPYTRDTFGRTYDKTTGRPATGGPERMENIEGMGDDRIRAATFKDNAAGQKSLTDDAYNDSGRWDSKMTSQVRKEWKAEPVYKYYQDMDIAFGRMEDMYRQAQAGASNIPDQAMLTMFAKLLDPQSVVRGPEVDALIAQTGIVGVINDWKARVTKDGRLPPEDRKAFMEAAAGLHRASAVDAMNMQSVYQKKAQEGGQTGQVVWSPIEDKDYGTLIKPDMIDGATATTRTQQLIDAGFDEDDAIDQALSEGL